MALTLDQFMAALSGQESDGSYTAQNGRTAAYGRFQIMPENWPSWAAEAGLGSSAPQTAANQDAVARFKLQQYYNRFGAWEDVASAWYSGSPMGYYSDAQLDRKQGAGDEPSIREYVNSVMSRATGGSYMSSGTASPEAHAAYQSILKQIDELNKNPPAPGSDEYFVWLKALNDLTVAAHNMRPTTGSSADGSSGPSIQDTLTQDFGNKIQEWTAKIGYDQATAQRAMADIERFLGLREDSRARADLIQSGKDMVQKYGTAAGKKDFSANDLGAAFGVFADLLGVDRDSQDFARYNGTMRVDPEADPYAQDFYNNVQGEAPTIPGMISDPSQIPGAPNLMGLASVYSGAEYGQQGGAAGTASPYYGGVGVDQGAANDPDLAPAPYYQPAAPAVPSPKLGAVARAGDPNNPLVDPNAVQQGAGKVAGGIQKLMPIKNPYFRGKN